MLQQFSDNPLFAATSDIAWHALTSWQQEIITLGTQRSESSTVIGRSPDLLDSALSIDRSAPLLAKALTINESIP